MKFAFLMFPLLAASSVQAQSITIPPYVKQADDAWIQCLNDGLEPTDEYEAATSARMASCNVSQQNWTTAVNTWITDPTTTEVTRYLLQGELEAVPKRMRLHVRARVAPDTPIGKRLSVGQSQTYREPGGYRMVIHSIWLKGEPGAKYRVTLEANADYGPDLGQDNPKYYSVTSITGNMQAQKKIRVIELKTKERTQINISQVGVKSDGSLQFVPYTIFVEKLPT